ncbi:actin-related protein 8 isoform X3 [Phyllopteryx taeniolatus]|uniref:actin-related protein 8 isoform X3 n=1 Tax=Phyllopteryx taeniolatus TaxID=161469 RepID=UPI002AD42626|nr:actin-related protein 8 isoform X3 [Phyllopteryx taeniolatus]
MTQAEKEQENGKEKEKERDKEKEREQRGVKRPIAPPTIPEPLQEQIQSNFVIVIHPGSRTLRVGRATDNLPLTVPHVIARRHKQSGQPRYEDARLLRDGLNKPESNEQRQNGLKMVDQAIWSKKMSNGVRRTPVSAEQARAYNCQIRPAVLDGSSRVKWTNTAHHPPHLIGDEALYVKPTDCYDIHWPIVRGQLNVHAGPGGSLTAVLADLETIWSHVIQKNLEIPLKDLKYYRCILLVPDIYNRQHAKELVSMLLLNMGFSGIPLVMLSAQALLYKGQKGKKQSFLPFVCTAIIVHQESVCATFGSGLSSACVVDVGDQKTSLCCVEDGVSHRNSRLSLAYGGADVTRILFWLLQRAGFPYRDCQLSNRLDCQLLQHIKETLCHLDQDISGLQDHEFQTRFPDSPAFLFQVRLGDEKLQAPMGLFYPSTFGIVGQKMTSLQYRSQGDAEDPHDELYLLATHSKQDQSSKSASERKAVSRPGGALDGDVSGQGGIGELSELPRGSGGSGAMQGETDIGPAQGECLMGVGEAEEPLSRKTAILNQFEGKALGLDKAILHSIDCCGKKEKHKMDQVFMQKVSRSQVFSRCLLKASDETKRKMYSSILVVGGGLMFHGAQEFLLHRIINKMPPSFRRLVDNVEVITRPKDMDPRLISWKGGAVLACLDTTQEMWIHQREWQRFGVRMLRERAAFVW